MFDVDEAKVGLTASSRLEMPVAIEHQALEIPKSYERLATKLVIGSRHVGHYEIRCASTAKIPAVSYMTGQSVICGREDGLAKEQSHHTRREAWRPFIL